MRIPELISRLQNPQILTWVRTNNGTIPLSKWEHPLGLTHFHTLSVSPTEHQLQAQINPGHNDLQIWNQGNPGDWSHPPN